MTIQWFGASPSDTGTPAATMQMGQPVAVAAQPMQQMQVVVPDGVQQGSPFQFQLPSGEAMQVVASGPPGTPMMIQLPAQQPMMAPQPQMMMQQSMGAPVVMGIAISEAMQQQALSVGAQDQAPLLDPQTMGVLAAVKSFRVNQRVKFWEAFSGGCCEQSNTYDFFDQATGAHLFIAQETSEDMTRCCCAPFHTLRVDFKAVNAVERQWQSRGAIAALPTVMHMEREGCCAKWGLGCFACNDGCKDGMTMNAGPAVGGEPGQVMVTDATFAYANQPKCGGWFTPTINLWARTSQGSAEKAFGPIAKVEGPFCFGGCSELCFNSDFTVSSMTPEQIDSKLMVGDLAHIVKERPKGACACGRELFTDSDTFTVTYADNVGLTPQQKAAMMGSTVLADYMFFEHDNGMCSVEGSKIKITLFETYCCGTTCPCILNIDTSQSPTGGAPPTGTEIAGAPPQAVEMTR